MTVNVILALRTHKPNSVFIDQFFSCNETEFICYLLQLTKRVFSSYVTVLLTISCALNFTYKHFILAEDLAIFLENLNRFTWL